MRFYARHATALMLLSGCATPPEPSPPPAPAPTPAPAPRPVTEPVPVNFSTLEREILHYVNVERSRNNLDTLLFNSALDKAAKIQAVEMAAERKMAHELPGAAYPDLRDRAAHVGYGYRHISENIAYGYPGARAVVDGWMRSAPHRANILYKGIIETGVGVARAKTGELYFAQVFGSRLY